MRKSPALLTATALPNSRKRCWNRRSSNARRCKIALNCRRYRCLSRPPQGGLPTGAADRFSGRRTSFLVGKSLARPYQGRCLTLEHINRLVHETTNAYLQRGYVTSQAWLQEQDISRGVLTVSVSEGRIESITQNGEQTPALKMAFPGLVGDVLNLRDIEQGMEQLNRLPSQQVTIDIQPGEQPGFSKVVLLRGAARVPVSFLFRRR